jgi:hyperosmotically inducible protein
MRAIHSLAVTSLCVMALAVATTTSAQSSASSAPMAAATDTGVNQRDRSSQTMTPFDQPNDKADIKLAAAVRRAIVKDKSLSSSAHNLKLIAAKGVVTLRGPVKNADEKSRVESLVQGVAGVSSVDNQLDVKN